MLGTIAGLWVSIGLAFIVVCILVGGIIGAVTTTDVKGIERKSILRIDLSSAIAERCQPGSFKDIIRGDVTEGSALDDIVNAVRLAANDSKIEGIYLDCGGSSAGFATREEIAAALRDFKKSGKWIYAYADTYMQGDYLLASVADKIFLNPFGSVDVRGVGTTIPFYKGLMDKLGVKVSIVKVGTFKSAVEPFVLTEMSEPNRLQYQTFVDSIWTDISGVIADNRGVSRGEVDMWADSIISTWPAERILEAKAVTELKYRRAVEDMLRDITGVGEDEDLRFVSPADYVASRGDKDFGNSSEGHIAVLYAVGDIVDSGDGGIVGETMVPEIIKLAKDDNVKALVLRVNSGGGSAFASEQIWEALEYFKEQDKPFYVSMGDYAASGGYYISCGADRIFADHNTLTGSIGVFGMIPDFSGLVTDKFGITFSSVQSGPNANFPDIMKHMPDNQLAALQNSVNQIYDTFTGHVATGRHMDVDSVKAIAEGRVWIGASALELGLVDELGSLRDCVVAIADEVGISPDKFVAYPEVERDAMYVLMRQFQNVETASGMKIDAETVRHLEYLNRLRQADPVQARMDYILVE